jgi:DNA-binding HxlR family transcriptional regulator
MTNIEKYLENPVKKHIIINLLRKGQLRYSQLQPKDIDNVLFNYHLQHLVKRGIVEKKAEKYKLSTPGIELTASVSYQGKHFKKFVCRLKMYLINQETNEVLFKERTKAPWLGDITPISCKLTLGNNMIGEANEEMQQGTGLKTDMKHIGTLRQRVENTIGEIVDDCIYFVLYGLDYSGKLENKGNSLMWVTFDEAKRFEANNDGSGRSEIEILERFEKKDFSQFFYDEKIVSNMF